MNEETKQKMEKLNRQLKMISYKGEEIGIQVLNQEESHSSKCDFLKEEPIGHREHYSGKRIYNATCHGGLFRSGKDGIIINADVQGGYNIIKKAIPKAFTNLQVIRSEGIEGVGLHPMRINPLIY